METRHILVAGGAGYIGSHTAKQLRKAGFIPVILDTLITGNRFALRFGPFVEGTIADQKLVLRIIKEYQIAGVILFAAHAYVGESTANPSKYYVNNVAGSLLCLDALIQSNVRALVFSSSCSIYGSQKESAPILEDSLKKPLSPYAETKLFLEGALRWYESAYGLRSACLRYFNAAGADPDGELGEFHDPETHLLPLAIYAALGREPLKVFGTDYPTFDGTAVRDYIHVMDLADAHVRALHYLLAGKPGMQTNIGTGQGHSVRDVIRAVQEVSGQRIQVEYGPRRLGDAASLIADPSRARSMLGWTPQLSSLEMLVQTAWTWHSRLQSPAQYAEE